MAAHEQQDQGVVGVAGAVVGAIWIPDLRWRPLRNAILSLSPCLVGPQEIREPT